MKYITRIFLFLLIGSTLVIFGYEAIKFSRDQVRITNVNAVSRVLMYLQVTEGKIPPSGQDHNLSEYLYEKKLMDKVVRDPVFTSATVLLDEYALMLVNLYEKIGKAADLEKAQNMINAIKSELSTAFADEENVNENITRMKALLNDPNIQNNVEDLKEVMNVSDEELSELKQMLKDADLRNNINAIKNLASQPVPPECVLVYFARPNQDEYELSVKLESRFLQNRMREDGGNDDLRYEIGNNLKFDTSLSVYGSKIKAVNNFVSVIK